MRKRISTGECLQGLRAKNVKVEKRNNRQSKRKQKQSGVQRLQSSRGGIQFRGAPGGGSRVD